MLQFASYAALIRLELEPDRSAATHQDGDGSIPSSLVDFFNPSCAHSCAHVVSVHASKNLHL